MKKLLLVLAFISLAFAGAADWQVLAFIAIFSAFMVLLILYMLSYLVDSAEMRMMAKGELYQVFVTLIFLVLFVSFQLYSTTIFSEALSSSFGGTADHITYAQELLDQAATYQADILERLTMGLTIPLGSMASASASCSIIGTSFSYPGCIGIQVPFSSLMFATNVIVTAMLANNSQIVLLNLANSFFFPILLPIGLFLRCFQFTRGAGGLLIAIAFSFYFIFPIAIMLTAAMAAEVDLGDPMSLIPGDGDIAYPSEDIGEEFASFGIDSECNPLDMDPNAGNKQAKRLVGNSGGEMVDSILYVFFVQGLFTTGLNILITLAAVRGLAKVFGAEVDVSALARIS